MDAPPVQYLKSSDGWDIAYAVCGQGRPLVIASSGCDHVQLAWRYPGLSTWLPALAARFRIIQLDLRGRGMSRRGLPPDVSAMDYQRDLRAVVDHLGLEHFILYSAAQPGPIVATRYAIDHPGRVKGIILSGAYRIVRVPGLFDTIAAQDWQLFLQSFATLGSTSSETHAERAALQGQAWDQQDFLANSRAIRSGGLGDLLPQVTTPVLVLHPRDYQYVTQEEAMAVARLARAQLAFIDGGDTWGNLGQGIRAIENFVAGIENRADRLAANVAPSGASVNLSSRELEVLRQLAQGKSNQRIAAELFITVNTVQNHVKSIYRKAGLSNRTQAAVYAKEHRLV